MAGKTVVIKLKASTSRFIGAMKKVGASVKRVGARVARMGMNVGRAVAGAIASAGALTAAFLGVGGVLATFASMRGFIKLGADLDHLKAQTGIAAGELMVLRQSFEDAGVDGDKVGLVINKMQKAIVDARQGVATYTDALAEIGLTVEDLDGKGASKQFEIISQAIAGTEDQATRTATAMDLFGRGGAAIMPLIMAPETIKENRNVLGDLPDQMNRLSPVFERIDTIIGRLKMKLYQVFAPIIEHFLPRITAFLEDINATNFGEFGQKITKVISAMINMFKQGNLGDFLADALIAGATSGVAKIIPLFVVLFKTVANMAVTFLSPIIAEMHNINPMNAFDKVTPEDVQKRIGTGINKIDGGNAAEMIEGLGADARKRLGLAIDKFGEEFMPQQGPPAPPKPAGALGGDEDAIIPAETKWNATVASSLAQVGGGGGTFGGDSGWGKFMELQRENVEVQKKKEQHLKEIKQLMERGPEVPKVEVAGAPA